MGSNLQSNRGDCLDEFSTSQKDTDPGVCKGWERNSWWKSQRDRIREQEVSRVLFLMQNPGPPQGSNKYTNKYKGGGGMSLVYTPMLYNRVASKLSTPSVHGDSLVVPINCIFRSDYSWMHLSDNELRLKKSPLGSHAIGVKLIKSPHKCGGGGQFSSLTPGAWCAAFQGSLRSISFRFVSQELMWGSVPLCSSQHCAPALGYFVRVWGGQGPEDLNRSMVNSVVNYHLFF